MAGLATGASNLGAGGASKSVKKGTKSDGPKISGHQRSVADANKLRLSSSKKRRDLSEHVYKEFENHTSFLSGLNKALNQNVLHIDYNLKFEDKVCKTITHKEESLDIKPSKGQKCLVGLLLYNHYFTVNEERTVFSPDPAVSPGSLDVDIGGTR